MVSGTKRLTNYVKPERGLAQGPGEREAAQRRSDSRREGQGSGASASASGSTGAGPECRAGESDEDANARMAREVGPYTNIYILYVRLGDTI